MNTSKQILASVAVLTLAALPVCADSIWPKNGGSLFTDNKAYRVGDIVTVVVAESTTLSNSAGSSLSKDSDTEGEIETLDWPKGSSASKVFTGDKPKVKFGATRTFDGAGSYSLSGSMRTSLTAVVMEVLPNGNLMVRPSKMEPVQKRQIFGPDGVRDDAAQRAWVESQGHRPAEEPAEESSVVFDQKKGLIVRGSAKIPPAEILRYAGMIFQKR